ncbi:0ae18326-4f2e-4cba-9a64-98a46c3fa7e9 [Sclerotinia trifoliorum]|uniref:0ae18326-4f2e-4cba-9a64-98a46c3fa7e9 n=1 Tax=Sclerotinia trifoliorum TaxID=28548 RepID=A0A8H2W2Y7_9HELO|nr:0ae18326-4f2e-4cba-9a64-98a46c3fa7e9 [Sclerotinia trifoliorum]
MAIYSSVPPPAQQASAGPDIEAWTASALESLEVSPIARGTGVTLSIPLEHDESLEDTAPSRPAVYKPRKELLKRDSQKHRESLLRGKEGSRRRQRWENDHFLHVPNAQPPLPSDWEVRPTYPVHHVPYYLAPLWDAGVRHRAEEIAAEKKMNKAKKAGSHEEKGRVPQDLRQKLKKSKGAKSLLQDLEEEVRKFVQEYEGKQKILGRMKEEEMDSEDEEIVFIGRNGTMSDEQRNLVEEELQREKLIFDSLADDTGASFGRWLVHSIASYYGLASRSVTVGDPARREAYVAIKEMGTGGQISRLASDLPRPLWGMI